MTYTSAMKQTAYTPMFFFLPIFFFQNMKTLHTKIIPSKQGSTLKGFVHNFAFVCY